MLVSMALLTAQQQCNVDRLFKISIVSYFRVAILVPFPFQNYIMFIPTGFFFENPIRDADLRSARDKSVTCTGNRQFMRLIFGRLCKLD